MADNVSIVKQQRHNAWDAPIPDLSDPDTLRPFSKVFRFSEQRLEQCGRSRQCGAFEGNEVRSPELVREQRETQAPGRDTVAGVSSPRSLTSADGAEVGTTFGVNPGFGVDAAERGERTAVAARQSRDGRRR